MNMIDKIKTLGDIVDETMLCSTILRYARSGHATKAMIEQAIVLVERHIVDAESLGDPSLQGAAERLKASLQAALANGVESLRSPKAPGPEVVEVEEPLARSLIARGHKIRRQHRCSGGQIDIYDLTADRIIECKARGTSAALGEAAGQLQRYGHFFPGATLVIAVPAVEPDGAWLADVLRSQGIAIIEMARGEGQ